MSVEQLAELINQVCGLSINWGKACIYYCLATHKLKVINWMPVLDIVAQKGSGKSRLIDILRCLCYKPYDICCYDKMTSVTLRNELEKAKERTAVIEEGDLYPNRKELEGYLVNRVDKKRTSAIPITHQVDTKHGTKWATDKFTVFGATIIHDRHEMVDMAAERRSILVDIKHRKGEHFFKPDKAYLKTLILPPFSLGKIPDFFVADEISDSALDTWEPLIRVAEGIDDMDWLVWAWEKVAEMSDRLSDGQQFEVEQVIFGALIQGYSEASGIGLMPNKITQDPLPLATITEIVKKQYPYIHPKTISTQLRKMGFSNIRNIGGVSKVITTLDEIKKIAAEIDYHDDKL
jgi:hypothetical protein